MWLNIITRSGQKLNFKTTRIYFEHGRVKIGDLNRDLANADISQEDIITMLVNMETPEIIAEQKKNAKSNR